RLQNVHQDAKTGEWRDVSCVVPDLTTPVETDVPREKKAPKIGRGVMAFNEALVKALDTSGTPVPRSDGGAETVRAVCVEAVRQGFDATYEAASENAAKTAFYAALNKLVEERKIGTRKIKGTGYVWAIYAPCA